MDVEIIAKEVVDSAITVHKHLGPGLLESVYQTFLAFELSDRGLIVACEVALPVNYRGHNIDYGYRLDMLIEECVIVENKVVDRIIPIHKAQLLTYLRLKGCWLGFILNWNVTRMKDGIKRLVNGPKPLN